MQKSSEHFLKNYQVFTSSLYSKEMSVSSNLKNHWERKFIVSIRVQGKYFHNCSGQCFKLFWSDDTNALFFFCVIYGKNIIAFKC